MFLLILVERTKISFCRLSFTFHDVSINTLSALSCADSSASLHSTMFLLIPVFSEVSSVEENFTFHDVSINTVPGADPFQIGVALHSTMFLLIPVVYLSLQYRYNLTTFCQSCHFIIFILIFIFLDSSHF